MIDLSEQEILSRLTNFEDAFVERKSSGDSRDWLKTAVAFANTAPVGWPAILYIGVKNDGTIEDNAPNLDKLQKTLSEKLAEAYPPIYHLPKVLQQDGKQFLAVIIPGSENRPHFAGQSYVREGSLTREASAKQFARLIAEQNSIAREILNWRDKLVTVRLPEGQAVSIDGTTFCGGGCVPGRVVDCNQFYVVIEFGKEADAKRRAYSLAFIQISYDCERGRMELIALH